MIIKISLFLLDLKPANIFLTVQGAIKLGDLGLSRFFGNSTKFSFSLVGTPVCISNSLYLSLSILFFL
jgi:serine/threonine protein kinase